MTMTCRCGKLALYDKECRDCYENRLRHEARDDAYINSSARRKSTENQHRSKAKMYKNYEGNPPG